MGLDIRAYSQCKFVAPQEGGDYEAHEDEHVLIDGVSFTDRLDGLPQGWYAVEGVAYGFDAGSYSGYNVWREQLCRAALDVGPEEVWSDPDRFSGKPFVELIDFSDCEGSIGPKTSAKLLADFVTHPDLPGTVVDGYFEDKYRAWQYAFTLAWQDGFVVFA